MNARRATTELQYPTLLRRELEATQTLLVSACGGIPLPVRSAVERLVNRGGKRLRPAVVLLIAHLTQADLEVALLAAAGVEMLHTATLIHDDVIDNALVRRGVPTLNAQLPLTAAVLAGDIAFSQAARLIARTGIPPVVEHFSATLETICLGELDQMFRDDGCLLSQEAYFERIFAKTASLFALCAQIGPLLVQAPPEDIEGAEQFGRLLGEAFQITDDVLDLLGDSQTTGKPVGVDLRQGLATLPVILYAEDHPDDPRLSEVLGGTAEEPQIRRLLADLVESGATDRAMRAAQARAAEALTLLQAYPRSTHRCALEELVQFAVDRIS